MILLLFSVTFVFGHLVCLQYMLYREASFLPIAWRGVGRPSISGAILVYVTALYNLKSQNQ